MKITVAGKGGVGKTTLASLLARHLADGGLRTLVVDCDPNPNIAESFGVDSGELDRFSFEDLRRAGRTLELVRAPGLVEVEERLFVLGGPPSGTPLADAVARGIAGVLVGARFHAVVTDLGAGPELTRIAVGGTLDPADVCVVLTDGTYLSERTADRVEEACALRGVEARRVENPRGAADEVAARLADYLRSSLTGCPGEA